MRITEALTQQEIVAKVLLSGTDPGGIGTPEQLQEAQRELRRQEQVRKIMNSGKEELARSDLTFGRHHITHEPTGDWYRVWGGAVDYSYNIDVFYVDESGMPLMLERVGSQAEHERQLAKRAERRAEREAVALERRQQRAKAARK